MAERLTRGAVIEHAASLSDDIGLDELTITKLGRSLGIAPPGVYRHVADLGDLRNALGQQAAREVATALSAACAGLSGADALAALAHTLRAWAARHRGRYAALQVAPDTDDADGQAAAQSVIAVIASALRAYSSRRQPDRHGSPDPRHPARLHRAGAAEGFKQPRSLDQTFARVIDSLDTVLTGWSS